MARAAKETKKYVIRVDLRILALPHQLSEMEDVGAQQPPAKVRGAKFLGQSTLPCLQGHGDLTHVKHACRSDPVHTVKRIQRLLGDFLYRNLCEMKHGFELLVLTFFRVIADPDDIK